LRPPRVSAILQTSEQRAGARGQVPTDSGACRIASRLFFRGQSQTTPKCQRNRTTILRSGARRWRAKRSRRRSAPGSARQRPRSFGSRTPARRPTKQRIRRKSSSSSLLNLRETKRPAPRIGTGRVVSCDSLGRYAFSGVWPGVPGSAGFAAARRWAQCVRTSRGRSRSATICW